MKSKLLDAAEIGKCDLQINRRDLKLTAMMELAYGHYRTIINRLKNVKKKMAHWGQNRRYIFKRTQTGALHSESHPPLKLKCGIPFFYFMDTPGFSPLWKNPHSFLNPHPFSLSCFSLSPSSLSPPPSKTTLLCIKNK